MLHFKNIIDQTYNSFVNKWEVRVALLYDNEERTEILKFTNEPTEEDILLIADRIINDHNSSLINPRDIKRAEMAEMWRNLPAWIQEYYAVAFETVSLHLDNGNDDLAYNIISIIYPPPELEESKRETFAQVKTYFLNYIEQL